MPVGQARRENDGMVNVNAGWGGGMGGGPARPTPPVPLRARRARVVLRPLGWVAVVVALVALVIAVVALPYQDMWRLVAGSTNAEATVEPGDAESVRLGEGTWVLWSVASGSTADCPPDADGC